MDSKQTQSSVVFVIPHKGREELLVQTIQSIANLNKGHFEIEVFVVSQNTASELNEHFADSLNLSFAYIPEDWTIAKARNYGVSITQSEYIAFLDADICLAPDWLMEMFNELERTQSLMVGAQQASAANAGTVEKIRTALANVAVNTYRQFLPSGNLFLKRDNFARVGGFPEHLLTCEDYYFSHKLSQLGSLYCSGKTSYIHLGEDKALGSMYRKEMWRGQSNIASLKGRNVPLKEYPSLIVPLAILLSLCVGVIGLLTNHLWLFVIFTLVAFLPIAAYSLRLYSKITDKVSMLAILSFYMTYFPARGIGTLRGLFAQFGSETHS